MCILCQTIVRSEAVWTVHVNAKQHKEKVLSAKKLSEERKNATTTSKRAISPEPEQKVKKVKGILKNSTTIVNHVPDDFFDSNIKIPKPIETKPKVTNSNSEPMDVTETKNVENETELPEGFFDDPKLDAKVWFNFCLGLKNICVRFVPTAF